MSKPRIELLRRLRTLSQFNNEQLAQLADKLTLQSAVKKTRLIERGETEEFCLYILQGSVNTIAKDGAIKLVECKSEGELSPIAHIRPSMYDVDAAETIEYIKIPTGLLTGFAQLLENDNSDMEVITIEQTSEECELTIQLFQDITCGNIKLPSLPDVAQKIQQAFSQPDINAEAVSRIIHSDPAITAKLIMIANSALYGAVAQINTLQNAIVRIGLDATRKQVFIYVVKELFDSCSPEMKLKLQRLWKHSRRVSAFSRILAKQSGKFDPEQAQLGGLIHDLGEIAILQYVQQNPDNYSDEEVLMHAIRNLRPQITSMLLHKWKFTADLVTVGEESEDWFRNPDNQADLCDLVMIAQYHSFIGTEDMKRLPPISKMPAYAKLGLSTDNPQEIMEFMKNSKAEINEIEKLLGSI